MGTTRRARSASASARWVPTSAEPSSANAALALRTRRSPSRMAVAAGELARTVSSSSPSSDPLLGGQLLLADEPGVLDEQRALERHPLDHPQAFPVEAPVVRDDEHDRAQRDARRPGAARPRATRGRAASRRCASPRSRRRGRSGPPPGPRRPARRRPRTARSPRRPRATRTAGSSRAPRRGRRRPDRGASRRPGGCGRRAHAAAPSPSRRRPARSGRARGRGRGPALARWRASATRRPGDRPTPSRMRPPPRPESLRTRHPRTEPTSEHRGESLLVEVTDLKVVRYEVDGRVAIVTLDRPDRLNAWTGRMHTEYRWCLARAEADPAVRAVVVTGAGRGFCAGADTAALDGHVQAGRYDPGTPDELARPGYGVRTGVRPRLRVPLRHAPAGDRRGQRAGRRRRARARLLLRHPLRRRGRQAHDLGRPARPPGRVRAVLGAPPAGRHRPRRRPADLEPGGGSRGSRQDGAREPGPPTGRAPPGRPRVRAGHRHVHLAGVGPSRQGAALRRPPRRRRASRWPARRRCSSRWCGARTSPRASPPGATGGCPSWPCDEVR